MLDYGVHAVEFLVTGIVLTFAAILSGHLLVVLWHVIETFDKTSTAIGIRTAVTEALDVLIMLELAQVFIRLEAKQQIGVTLVLDTAILFSVRETILELYGAQAHLTSTEMAVAVFVALRIIYSWKKTTAKQPSAKKTDVSGEFPGRQPGPAHENSLREEA
ncbi:hypothetical protein [Thiomonas sp.]